MYVRCETPGREEQKFPVHKDFSLACITFTASARHSIDSNQDCNHDTGQISPPTVAL